MFGDELLSKRDVYRDEGLSLWQFGKQKSDVSQIEMDAGEPIILAEIGETCS